MNSQLLKATEQLASIVDVEWKSDIPSAPAWFALEGERVSGGVKLLLDAVRNGTEKDLLRGTTVADYLGSTWVDCHSKAYDQIVEVQRLLDAKFESSVIV